MAPELILNVVFTSQAKKLFYFTQFLAMPSSKTLKIIILLFEL